jgi:hypothetical protein
MSRLPTRRHVGGLSSPSSSRVHGARSRALRPAVTLGLLLAMITGLPVTAAAQAAKPAPAAASAARPAAAASAALPSSPAKKALAKRILVQQEAGFEAVARGLIEQPAGNIMQQVYRTAQTSVPAEKRDAVVRDAQADVRKFVDEMVPLIRKRALEIAPAVIGPQLEDKFSEDELKQLATFLESPVSHKYHQLGSEMQQALSSALIDAARPLVEPRMRALETTLMKRLGIADQGGKAPVAPRAASDAAKK